MIKAGEIVVDITANSTKFISDVSEAEVSLKNFGSQARGAISSLAKYTAAATAAGVATTTYLVGSAINAIEEQAKLAKISNTTQKEFVRQAHAARTVGIEHEKLGDIFKDVNDRVGDFLQTGGGPMADFFTGIAPKIGVTAEQFRKLSGPQALQLFVSSLEKANLSQQEMTFYMEAIASDATALLPLFRDNGKELQRLGEEADKFGLSLTQIEVEKVRQSKIAFQNIQSVLDGVAQQLAVQIAPLITAFSKSLTEAATEGDGIKNKVGGAFDFIVDSVVFAIRAVDGLKRAVSVFSDISISAFATVKAVALKMVIAISEQLNKLPGVDIDISGLSSSVTEAEYVVFSAWENIQSTLMQPIPGDNFRQFAEEARIAAEEAAAAAVEIQNNLSGVGGGTSSPMAEQARADMEAKLAVLKEQYATEKELLQMKYLEDQVLLEEALLAEQLTRDEYNQLRLQSEEALQTGLNDIEKKAADKRKQIAKAEAAAKMNIVQTALGGLSTLMNSESKKQFELGKKAAIANSLISTFTGMAKALELGFPVGLIAAAAMGIAGFAQVQNIRSQQFQGGGSGAGAAGSVTGSINAASTPAATNPAVNGGQPQQVLRVEGLEPDALFSGSFVQGFAKRLVDFQEDGGKVIV